MGTWIFQDKPGVDMAAQLRKQGVGTIWDWNIDRYVRRTTIPHIEEGDTVLQWQARLHEDRNRPAGVYARGVTTGAPSRMPNPEGDWHVDVLIEAVYDPPLTSDQIKQHPDLVNMQIFRMAQHRVFIVTPDEWTALQELLDEKA